MARHPLDEQIDQLYQLPLEAFTAARNALAKGAGAQASGIKSLEKPTAAAWAVNQLFWRERPIYDELIEKSQQLRAAYRDQLAGKSADVSGAEANHRAAVRRATQSARALAEAGGGTPSDAVIDAVRETLDILPGSEPLGRLTKPLKRTGFEALAGFTFSAPPRPAPTKLEPRAPAGPRPRATGSEQRVNAAAARDREMTMERLRFAEAAEREAEAALDRAHRAVERAQRTRERVERELADASAAQTAMRQEETVAKATHAKAAAERARLAAKLQP